ncbi:MAG: helicase C-terminal domain-containing protein [Paludisphaera borealis]|uniref:ATP-dependent DNA helicase n=1 Tax=Paludisphaera borealis TaxID=1387353 RepID=UPI0028459AD8|nr:helicase C-terminal domain-containing protein [Paludisphaera borealis]MDR3621659.1 helicase C-terminal domain-containing protein [Paludisphaera borealis]
MATTRLDPASILGPDGAVARRLKSYEVREQQLQMADAVAKAIEDRHHLVVEAGTGVGKSFAYLVPAIMAAVEMKKKIVVSTHTIALQEQLLSKDIPFLRSVMPQEFSAVLVKGRGNYVSLRRLDVAVSRQATTFQSADDLDQLASMRMWAGRTQDGTRSDLDFRPNPGVWDAVQSENGNCLGRECPRHKECFYFKARRRVWTANLLIVNHALFVSDLALRASGFGLLPDYDVAIFDEAHTLEAVAGEHLGLQLSNVGVDYTLARLYNDRTKKGTLVYHHMLEAIEQVRRVRTASEDFFEVVAQWHAKQGSSGNGRVRKPIDLSAALAEELRKLGNAIDRGSEDVAELDTRIELSSAAERCEGLADQVQSWVRQSAEQQVYWVESENKGRRRIRLASAPLDVGPTLRKTLFEQVPTCVLTSATLCVGSPPKFDFLKSRLGLTRAETLALGSPFDYPRQVKIHLARNLPDPSEQPQDYERQVITAIAHYLEQTQGKAFVLFTSYRMLDAAARALTPWLAKRNIALFAQSDGMPRSKMVEAFKADVDSVIFGADSFWQGVDVPGESLSNVIIVRLPFSVPSHPLLEARLEEIRRRGGNPFVEYQIPEAVIKLKQGFGRLIRTRTDQGIVAILDPRVLTKPYGKTFLNSLPECPRIVDQHDFSRRPSS